MSDHIIHEYKGDEKLIATTSLVSDIDDKTTIKTSDVDVDDYVSKFIELSNSAKAEDSKDKSMPLREGVRTFPKAVLFSLILSSCLIMEGYDTSLLASMYSNDSFKLQFGNYYSDIDQYQVPAKWQTAFSMGYQTTQLIGLLLGGTLADAVGYRKTIIPVLVIEIGFIFVQFFAATREILLLSYLLCGLVYGSLQVLAVCYATDVAPSCLRLYLTSYINVAWVIGQLVCSVVLKGIQDLEFARSYRIAYAIQWFWPIPIIIGVYFAPESPYYLVRKGRIEEAKQSLKSLLTDNKYLPDKSLVVESMVTKIQLVIKEEDMTGKGATFKECFTGTDFRRTRIAAIVWMIQNVTGASLMGYSTYFYQQAGLDTSMSFTFTIIQYVLGMFGTFGSWVLSRKLGRYSIFFYGLCIMLVLLLVTGGLGCADSNSVSWGIGSMLLVYTFVYDISIGPIIYCIVAEIPSAKLRQKTVMMARFLYNVAGIVVSILSSYMLNPTAFNWGAKSAFLWAGLTIISIIWAFFEVPETKNRTFAELDKLFADKVPARKFKTTEANTFDAGEMMEKLGSQGIKDVVNEREHIEYVDDESR
ncbi:MAL1 [Candida pseudojiufengensis]|uniref:MAL1 n=1 Tax=Candida pseudojiufengensis TaxID=497109 RepID=UPI0022252FFF|nr:MAL1 [Candida pseudojiufengensis]KAI5961233.1 MAL1 [Candida pseudojiufengensis]